MKVQWEKKLFTPPQKKPIPMYVYMTFLRCPKTPLMSSVQRTHVSTVTDRVCLQAFIFTVTFLRFHL